MSAQHCCSIPSLYFFLQTPKLRVNSTRRAVQVVNGPSLPSEVWTSCDEPSCDAVHPRPWSGMQPLWQDRTHDF
ncbi:hypothetical protein AWU68_0104 [Corynebacterium simulans]|nr:hypothetical protein AWU68_0104 [Corynebacterium simulans]